MKKLSFIIVLIGLIWLAIALNMDVSVDTGYGRVNNLGLMADRQNYLFISAFMVVIGLVLYIFSTVRGGVSSGYKCPYCAEKIQREAIKCKHCGSDLSSNHPTKASLSLDEWDAKQFYSIEGSECQLNEVAVDGLIDRIKRDNPGVPPAKLIDMYQRSFDGARNNMPPDIAKRFAKKFYTDI